MAGERITMKGSKPENETVETFTEEAPEVESGPEDESSQILMELMADPDVRAILTARQQGQQTKVSVGEEAPPAPDVDDEIEDVDPEVKKILKFIDRKVTAQLKPLNDKVQGLETVAQGFQRQSINSQIKTTSVKHPDFNKYRKQMAGIAREVGGLNVEELYLLAKHRSGDLKTSEPSAHSERPTPTPGRRRERESTETIEKRGRRQFQSILADALDNIESAPEI